MQHETSPTGEAHNGPSGPEASSQPIAPLVALVGRPNVGKSTLFNRLTRTREALVAPIAGVTRDRREGLGRIAGFRFRVVDTGGLGFAPDAAFAGEIATQVSEAIRSADVVWLVVDAAAGLNPFDTELFRLLQKQGKPMIAVANKADSPGRRDAAAEFYALGAPEILPISALHGSGVQEALEATARRVPALAEAGAIGAGPADRAPRIAFIGRPNAGKSSLINRILGQPRQIVSEVAGTTREAVELPFRLFDRDYLLVDTAGIRRRARTTGDLEKLSVVNALTALNQCDVAVLVLDATLGAAEQDARITGYALERGRGLVVAMNKWDLLDAGAAKDVEADIAHTLRFVEFAPRVRISAATGAGLERLFKEVRTVAREFAREVQTADLNRIVQLVTRQTPPPAKGHSPSKVHYGTQIGTRPPSFRFFANHPERIPESYTRFMEHQLRYHFGFRGVPLVVNWQGREDNPDAATRRAKPRAPAHAAAKRPAQAPAQRAPAGKPQRPPGGKPKRKPAPARRGKGRRP